MTDNFSNLPLTSVTLTNVTAFLAAVGGLGTAAYGLVDASKALGGGMSLPGFGYIQRAVAPLVSGDGSSAFGSTQILETLKANWLNGVAKADQKAAAKSLIRLGLTADSAPQLAKTAGVDPAALTVAAGKVRRGEAITPQDLNVLGEFDVIVSAILDRGYERADQLYRNCAKIVAAIVAIALAVFAGAIGHAEGYLGSPRLFYAIFIGALSTPLAPIAKDLSSSLSAAVKAVGSVKR